ncbi:urease accessory protein UreF [Paenibacillus athensensis]|uniref:Urease accessory protein UreF n=1 Tax=Paenibacillus athensensis TaxID=1967502 RepID=A0A4Y8Q638_9BACL|nr:urease accessory protein UreF [Paenibacillus athensensis]MCD1259831.1 urease accessory protein UreF [Paenibacillus athensensis]
MAKRIDDIDKAAQGDRDEGTGNGRNDAHAAAPVADAPGAYGNYHWLAYQQLLDSALPIGGFSHSFGLETLVQQDRLVTLEDLEGYVQTMLFMSWTTSDAMAIKAVYRYAPLDQWSRVWEVDQLLHVQRAAAETRTGVQKMGRRLQQLARAMYPQLPWANLDEAVGAGRCDGTHALMHGWVSYHLQVPLERAVEGFLYTCIVTCVNSALRLMSMGQTQGQVLLAKLLPLTTAAWRQAADLEPLDAWTNAPAADLAMMQHETLYSRLFMS